jgi:hypothetical protein
MKLLDRVAKAVTGGLVAGYAVFQISSGIASDAGAAITQNEWVSIIATLVITAGTVWAVPNAKDPV